MYNVNMTSDISWLTGNTTKRQYDKCNHKGKYNQEQALLVEGVAEGAYAHKKQST